MRSMKYCYSILGLGNKCGIEEIKTAYRRLAKKHHPDIGGDPDLFRDIQDAYEILSDPSRRKEYDDLLAELPFGGQSYKTIAPAVIHEPLDVFDDIIDVLGRRFGMETKSKLHVILPLTPEEASDGINIELSMSLETICCRCFGFGETIISTCRGCGGKGSIMENKKTFLALKPGVGDGEMIFARSGNTEISGRIKIKR